MIETNRSFLYSPTYRFTYKGSSQKLFFSSDHHFFHERVILYDQRPWESLEEMHKSLVEIWNNVVPVDGTVFYLGDLCFKAKPREAEQVRDLILSLNGQLFLIVGNHDQWIADILPKFPVLSKKIQYVLNYCELDTETELGNKTIVLSHYPLQAWNGSFRKRSYHFHGHVHKNKLEQIHWLQNRLNIACCNHEYSPINLNHAINLCCRTEGEN